MENKIVAEFGKNKIITVLRKVDKDKIIDLVEAMYRGGIRFAEVPFDQKDEASNETTAEEIKMLIERFKGRMHIGAGTVITEKQLELAYKAGAEMIIAPCVDIDIIKKTKKLGLVSIPGAFSPSEMVAAHKAGADLIKLFPATGITLKMVKEISVPLNNINLVFFGGVTPENFKEVLSTGVYGVGVASGIVKKDLIEAGKFDEIEALARAYTSQL